MSGPLADELAGVALQAGMTFQEAFQACIRIGLPKVVAMYQAKRSGRRTKRPPAKPEKQHGDSREDSER
jgi:hypothetical protein